MTSFSSIWRNSTACAAFMTSGGSYGWNEYEPSSRAGLAEASGRVTWGRQRAERAQPAAAVGIDVPRHEAGDQVLLAHAKRRGGAVELVDRRRRQPDEQRALRQRPLRHINKISKNILESTR